MRAGVSTRPPRGSPAAARLARRRELTVLQLIELYLAEGFTVQSGHRVGQPMKLTTAQRITAVLRNHVAPLIGAKKLGDIAPPDIERMARAVAAGKTGKARARRQIGRHIRGGSSAARKAVRVCSTLFGYAMRRDLMAANPCSLAKVRRSDSKRDRYLGLDEIAMLGKAIVSLEGAGKINRKAADIVRLLLFTGCRRNEINRLTWDEVDLKGMRLVLAGPRPVSRSGHWPPRQPPCWPH